MSRGTGKFLQAEDDRGRNDLILPIYYLRCRVLEEEECRQSDYLARIIHQRQRWDWRDQRLRTFRNRNVRLSIEALAWEIEKALRRPDVADARHERPEPGFIFRDKDASWCPEMVVVPRGEFLMASPDALGAEQPRHLIRIAYPLAVGRYPVTFDEYDHFCETTRRQHPSDQGRGRGPRPVINVSWNDARAYSTWLSEETGKLYRLPKEAEWEYVARAGAHTHWVTDPRIKGFAWTEEDERRLPTIPIDAFAPHPWGILGIYSEEDGIWEWCEESWHDPIRGPVRTDESDGKRVARCFSWLSDPPWLGTLARLALMQIGRKIFVAFGLLGQLGGKSPLLSFLWVRTPRGRRL